jgi:predicted acyl esterase
MVDDIDLPAETRRNVLKYLGVAAGLGGVGTQVSDPFAHPVAALSLQQDAFTTEERRIESHDGIELDATVYEPTAEGPHPAVLMTHGWGGDKRQLRPLAEAYASRDFYVLAYTSRGFGKTEDREGSGGQVNSTSELERRDASALIDYLASQDAVMNDGENDPRVGMDGVSYGGGIQLRTAAEDDRLDAIVPRATWYDLAQALAANGVVKTGWLRALELGANQAAPTGDVAPDVNQTSTAILERGFLTEEDVEFYQSRSPVTYGGIDTPALLIPEWTDQLFPTNQGVDNFRKIQESGADTTLIVGQDGTHILGQGDDFPPGSGLSRQFVGQQAIRWLDAYLRGDGDPGLATYHYFDADAAADAESPADAFQSAQTFPPYERQSLSHSFGRTVELTGGDANVVTVDREITEETELNGIPELTVEATPTGEGPSHLFVAIQRVREGEPETIKQQITPYRLEESDEITVDLFGIQATFQPGDVLRVALSAREGPLNDAEVSSVFGGQLFANTPDGAGVEIASGTELTMSVPASQPLPEQPGVPTPAIEELTGGNGQPQTAAVHDIEGRGYTEQEYVVSGTARPEAQEIALLEEGSDPPLPDDVAEYATRILVYRPEDEAEFNGDVLVDWMNVTQQRDAPVTWINAFEYLMREGYAVMLVSAQKAGVDNSAQNLDLVTWDSDRYGDLNHPGDAYSFDIFAQVMKAAKASPSGDPLGDLSVENVFATGMSQSGYYLNRYIARVHVDHGVADGFLPVAANVVEPNFGGMETPTLLLNTEDEVPEPAPNLVPDGENFRFWQVAGASHVNVYLSIWVEQMEQRDFGQEPMLAQSEEWNPEFAGQYGQLAEAPYGICGTNYFPVRYAYRSALDQLRGWVRDGEAPPETEPIQYEDEAVVTDEYDNTQGGVRLPVIEEPVASYLARDEVCEPTEQNPLADLRGATERLSESELTERYDGRESYISALESAAEEAVSNGVLLDADREALLERAQSAAIPSQSGEEDGEGDTGDGGEDMDGGEDTDGGESDDGGTDDGGSGDDGGSSDDGGPGFGIPAALGGAGGLGYLLKQRLSGDDDQFETEADD